MKLRNFTRIKSGWLLLGLYSILILVPQVGHTDPADQDKIRLEEAFHRIGEKFDVFFNYDRSIAAHISVEYEENLDHTLDDAMKYVLENTNLGYQIFDQRFVVVFQNNDQGIESLKEMIGHVQGFVDERETIEKRNIRPVERLITLSARELYNKRMVFSVSGTVTDQEGEPLIGVNIQVKGTNQGTATDFEGRFTLEDIDENAVLIVSYVGYQSREVPVAGKRTLTITLMSDSQLLDEVVVVGYGTQKKSDITGAVSNINEEKLQSRPVASFSDALQGRSSGVQIRQAGGDLEGKFDIAIRGVGSVTGSNDPLIVIDGIPLFSANFSTINPTDIASIDILKDASATAIYGARAANGVVIITTKKGKVGRPKLILNIDQGIENISKRYDVMTTEQQRQLFVEAFKNSNRSTAVYDDPNHEAWSIDNDWQKLGTRSGARQNYNLTVMGGTEAVRYSVSGGFLNRKGILLNTDLQSYSLRGNVSSEVNNWLSISTNLAGSHQSQNYINHDSWGAAGYRGFVFRHSYTPAYDENGDLTAVNSTAAPYFGSNQNPLINVLLPTREKGNSRILGNLKADIILTEGLTLTGNFGGDLVKRSGYVFDPVYSIGRYNNPDGSVNVVNQQDINWVGDVTVDYNKKFGVHTLNMLVGASIQQFIFTRSSVNGKGTIDNALNQLSNQTDFNANGSKVSGGLASGFGRLNYSFEDKYLMTATIRRDGSSKFGSEKRYGIFPSGSLAWRISKEGFFQENSSIDELKLRISYGLTGNQSISDFAFITRAEATPYVFGNSIVVGNSASNIGNPSLQWEANKQFDVGMDFGIYSGRITSTFDFYNKRSENLLITNPIPLTSGVNSPPVVNIGSVKNSGVEFSINSVNISGEFTWKTGFNISYNKNQVLDIGTNSVGEPLQIPGQNIPLSNIPPNITIAGHPVGAFYTFEYDGVWQLGQEDEASAWSNAVPGDPRYKDNNGNGVLDAGDKSFVGTPHPKFFGGLDNTFQYKDFSASVFLNFAAGNKLYNTARNLFSRGVPFVQNFAEVADFWTPDNPSTTVPRPSQGGNTTTLVTMVSDRFLEDAGYLRVKDISFSYNFPNDLLKNVSLENVKISLQAINLLTFTKYTGLDPEVSSRSSLLSAGIDYTAYPNTKQFNVSLEVEF